MVKTCRTVVTPKKEEIGRTAVTPNEAAIRYGFSVGTLANWRCHKEGPRFYKVGRKKIIYFLEDIEIWARKCPVLTKDCLPDRLGGQRCLND